MCGIVGILGKEPAMPILLEGLKRLEYRGYDSAGVAVLENGGLRLPDAHPQASYQGRRNGYETYSLTVPKGTLWLEFTRDGGVETVVVGRAGSRIPLQGFSSFRLARNWVRGRCTSDSEGA